MLIFIFFLFFAAKYFCENCDNLFPGSLMNGRFKRISFTCFCFLKFLKPDPAIAIDGLTKTRKMKVKWTQLGLVFFLLLSIIMTACFIWQYQLPKLVTGE